MTKINVGGGFFTANREKTLEAALDDSHVGDTILINNGKVSLNKTYPINQTVRIKGVGEDYVNVYLTPHSSGLQVGDATLKLENLRFIIPNQANAVSTFDGSNARIEITHCQFVHQPRVESDELFPSLYAEGNNGSESMSLTIRDSKVDYAWIDVQDLALEDVKIGSNYQHQSMIGGAVTGKRFSLHKAALYNTVVAPLLASEPVQLTDIKTNGRLVLNGKFELTNLTCQPLQTLGNPKKEKKVRFAREQGFLPEELTYLTVGSTANDVGILKLNDPVIFKRSNTKQYSGVKYRGFDFSNAEITLQGLELPEWLPLTNRVTDCALKLVDTQDKMRWEVDDKTETSNDNSTSLLFKKEKKTGRNNKPAMEQLNEMIGLSSVKEQIKRYVASAKMNAVRKANGLLDGNDKNAKSSLHMVFAGNPGTGKTVVAGIVAQVLYENGVLKSNKLVTCRQKDLVAGYVGQTAGLTEKKVKEALDGVLLIDEAYELAPHGGEGADFNNEAITQLVAMMDDPNYRDRLVVIMAGYDKDMREFFKSGNAGLQSRFRNWINFPDYSTKELCEILEFQRTGLHLTWGDKMAQPLAYQAIKELHHTVNESGGNGRLVRNLLSDVREAMDSRLSKVDVGQLSPEAMQAIVASDVAEGFQKEKEKALKLA